MSEAQYDDFTPTPDYDLDYNATFDNSTLTYSFFSNASSDELDELRERFFGRDEGGQGEDDATVTMATTQEPTGEGGVEVHGAASLPVPLEFWTLVWTLTILNTLQLQHTL